MLIEFSVKNYRSIKEKQILSLVKGSGDEFERTNTFLAPGINNLSLVSSAIIYGANGSGKSNLLKAIAIMAYIVRSSASATQGDKLHVTPFLFDDISANDPTEFEIIFISDNVKYQYGFSLNQNEIHDEWLYAFPKGRPQQWFSRVRLNGNEKYAYKFGEYFSGPKDILKKTTRENSLLLSTAIQLNNEALQPIFKWFRYTLKPVLDGVSSAFTASLCEKNSSKKKIINLMREADFSIHNLNVKSHKFTPEILPESISEDEKKRFIEQFKDEEFYDVKSVHKPSNNKEYQIDFDEESDGTQRFFSLAGPWLDVLANGFVLLVDELNNNLHPNLFKYLVGLFHNKETNPNNAQLILTTHDTSVLGDTLFRRDQIWFCEKDESQATMLYPLIDFSPRKGRENIEKNYLSGRYGGVPFISHNNKEI